MVELEVVELPIEVDVEMFAKFNRGVAMISDDNPLSFPLFVFSTPTTNELVRITPRRITA